MKLLAAFFADLALGDPEWIPTPHPVVLIGKAITTLKEKIIQMIYGDKFQAVLERRKLREPDKEIIGDAETFPELLKTHYGLVAVLERLDVALLSGLFHLLTVFIGSGQKESVSAE